MIIGVCGASGSGKTSFCKEIKDRIQKKSILIISLDSFYKSLPEGVSSSEYNFDHPNAFDIERLIFVLTELRNNRSVEIPEYDFVTHKSYPGGVVKPSDIIIVEGIMVFYWEKLRKLFTLKIFILTDLDNCLVRRILRDTKERGRTCESVLEQYIKFVKPSYRNFIRDTKEYADIIVPNNQDFSIAIKYIIEKLK